MRSFDYSKLQNCTIDTELLGFISKIREYKGRQTLYVHQKKDKLDRLVEIARIQSTESSNKIEGIYTTAQRTKEIINNKAKPKNRNEEEIAGYRDVLTLIHENYDYIEVNQNTILQ